MLFCRGKVLELNGVPVSTRSDTYEWEGMALVALNSSAKDSCSNSHNNGRAPFSIMYISNVYSPTKSSLYRQEKT